MRYRHPHLITQVTTTEATVTDGKMLSVIQQDLNANERLPQNQLVDAGYVQAKALVSSKEEYGIKLICPPLSNTSQQSRMSGGFAVENFEIDFKNQKATCPTRKQSVSWNEQENKGHITIKIKFSRPDCGACPMLEKCTKAKEKRRGITIKPQVEWEALQQARANTNTPDYKKTYAKQAGIEGTISQAIRRGGHVARVTLD